MKLTDIKTIGELFDFFSSKRVYTDEVNGELKSCYEMVLSGTTRILFVDNDLEDENEDSKLHLILDDYDEANDMPYTVVHQFESYDESIKIEKGKSNFGLPEYNLIINNGKYIHFYVVQMNYNIEL